MPPVVGDYHWDVGSAVDQAYKSGEANLGLLFILLIVNAIQENTSIPQIRTIGTEKSGRLYGLFTENFAILRGYLLLCLYYLSLLKKLIDMLSVIASTVICVCLKPRNIL